MKKIIALILSVLILSVVFVSCKAPAGNKTSTTDREQTSSSEKTGSTSESDKETTKETKQQETTSSVKEITAVSYYRSSMGKTLSEWCVDISNGECRSYSGAEAVQNRDCEKTNFSDTKAKEFLESMDNCGIKDWEKSYIDPAFRGGNWSVEIVFSDGEKKIVVGNKLFPEGWSDFTKAMDDAFGGGVFSE